VKFSLCNAFTREKIEWAKLWPFHVWFLVRRVGASSSVHQVKYNKKSWSCY
jgi:hypothetical protein